MGYKPIPRWKQRLGGVFIAFVGFGFTAWEWWYTVLVKGCYDPHASHLFPIIAVFGIGLTLFPSWREERIARGEDIAGLSGMKLLTPRWWAIGVISVLTGFGNDALMQFFCNQN